MRSQLAIDSGAELEVTMSTFSTIYTVNTMSDQALANHLIATGVFSYKELVLDMYERGFRLDEICRITTIKYSRAYCWIAEAYKREVI